MEHLGNTQLIGMQFRPVELICDMLRRGAGGGLTQAKGPEPKDVFEVEHIQQFL
jgi:hypothetical protein